MDPRLLEPLYHVSMKPTYTTYKRAVLKHIRKRRKEHKFEPIDESLVDMLSTLYADWYFMEKHASKSPKLLVRYSDALNKLTGQIRDLLNDLLLTPRARRQIMKELKDGLEKDPEVQELVRRLMGTRGQKRPR